ncbi:MAG: glycosyltransferase family 39 protein [Candidatus Levyibacteriota bacterium]
MIRKIFGKRFEISLSLVILLAVILRFVNYSNRWGLAYDQARDVIVSTYALSHHLIPLTGPFSSAGQFVYGPQWVWIVSAFVAVFPGAIMTPWIIQTLLYVLMVLVMFLIGKEIFGRNFGLLTAFFTAISTAQLGQSTNLISPSMAGIFSIIAVYFFIRYIKYSKNLDAFLLGFLVSNTINIHFQAIGLIFLLPVGFLISKRKFKSLLFLGIGAFIPFIPLVIFDLQNKFFESRNILDYYLYGQNRLYTPNRWLTYAGVFWPKAWSGIIGGQIILGYFFAIIFFVFTLWGIVKRKLDKNMLGLIAAFSLIFIMLRYYKGVIFDGYIVFLHPFVLVFSAWVAYKIFKFNKFAALLLIVIVFVLTMQANIREISVATNNTAKEATILRNQLIKKFPSEKFSVYDYKFSQVNRSYPFVMYMNKDNKIDDSGMKIGLANFNSNDKMRKDLPIIINDKLGFQIYDLSSSSSATLLKDKWIFVNPSEIYKTSEQWYKE